MTLGIFMFFFFTTWLKEAGNVNVPFTKSARTFIYSPEFYFFFRNI